MAQNATSQSNCRILDVVSQEKWMMNFIFSIQIKTEVFYKFILLFWVYVTRHAQSTHTKKFAYLCNISKNAWGIDFLPADEHQSFQQDDSITLGVRGQACLKFPE